MFWRNVGLSGTAAALVAAVSLAASSSVTTVKLGPPPHAVLSRGKLSAIDDFINGEIASGNIPGAIVLIQHHGQPVFFKCFGKRDVEKGTPMTADAIFPIHSVTKTITSVAAMMLVDRGKIALDDPVSKYIPSFAGMKVGVERKAGEAAARRAAAHVVGLRALGRRSRPRDRGCLGPIALSVREDESARSARHDHHKILPDRSGRAGALRPAAGQGPPRRTKLA